MQCFETPSVLRLLVGKIIVHPVGDREAEIEVITKGTGVVAVMATTPSSVPSMLTAVGAVHTSVAEWLQLVDTFRTLVVAPPPEVRQLFAEMRMVAMAS